MNLPVTLRVVGEDTTGGIENSVAAEGLDAVGGGGAGAGISDGRAGEAGRFKAAAAGGGLDRAAFTGRGE